MVVQPQQTTAKGKHATGGKSLAACDTCGMAFKKLEHLQRHIRTHTQDRPYPCTFPECGKAFARQDTLNRHARLHSREEQDGTKPRARKRTKSVSEGSGARRQSTSPYPTSGGGGGNPAASHRRRSSVSSAGSATSPVSGSFSLASPPAVTIPELSSSSSNALSGSSRFSTLDLLGLSFPSSAGDASSHLPALSELYPDSFSPQQHTGASPGANATHHGQPASSGPGLTGAFGSFSPMAHSLFLPGGNSGSSHQPQQQQQQQQQQPGCSPSARSPSLQTHSLEADHRGYRAPSAAPAASSPFGDSDDGSSTSDPSSLTPESLSTVATSFHSSFAGSPDELKHQQAQLPPMHTVTGFDNPISHMTIPEDSQMTIGGHGDRSHDAQHNKPPSSYIDDDDLMSLLTPADGNGKMSPMMLQPPTHGGHDAFASHSLPVPSLNHQQQASSSSVGAMSVPTFDQHMWGFGGQQEQHHSGFNSNSQGNNNNGLGMSGMSAPASTSLLRQHLQQKYGHQLNQHTHAQQQSQDFSWLADTTSFGFDLPPFLRDA